jgi:hypothetical protein
MTVAPLLEKDRGCKMDKSKEPASLHKVQDFASFVYSGI